MNNACPECGPVYAVTANDVGQRIACKKCGTPLVVKADGLKRDGGAAPLPRDGERPDAQAVWSSATEQAEQAPSRKPDDGGSRTRERNPDEDEERQRRPRRRRRDDEDRRRQRNQNRAGFVWLFGFPAGDFVALLGLLILLGYWLGYDTTVSSTHNIGLVNNREVGTMAGAAIMLAGLVCAGFARLAERTPDPNQRPRSSDDE